MKINETFYIRFVLDRHLIVFYTYTASQFGVITLQVSNNHRWLSGYHLEWCKSSALYFLRSFHTYSLNLSA